MREGLPTLSWKKVKQADIEAMPIFAQHNHQFSPNNSLASNKLILDVVQVAGVPTALLGHQGLHSVVHSLIGPAADQSG
jgi:hypothetical protein